MKDKSKLEVEIGVIFIFTVLIARGVYIYLKENIEPLEAARQVFREFGNFMLILVIGLVILLTFAFIGGKLSNRRRIN